MQRRGFLGAMLAACAGPAIMSNAIARGVIMPAREIWTPSHHVYVDNLITSRLIAQEALRILESKLCFSGNINTDWMAGDQWSKTQRSTIMVRKPSRYILKTMKA